MVSTIQDIMSLSHPAEAELLVSVFDLTHFTRYSRGAPSSKLFRQMSEFAGMCAEFVQSRGGVMIKFIGDAGLCIFPGPDSSAAVNTLVELKSKMDAWLKTEIPGSHLAVNCHFGPVTIGPMPGFAGQNQLDVIGETVNICFTLGKQGFIISPQAFRSLDASARKQFRKFTPPITYHLGNPAGR